MYDKSSPMEIISGEMLIFGQPLPRHPEFPWLFSATHLHKFCEEAIRRKAESVGKDPDKFYEAKRPGQWIRFNILSKESKERVERYAEHTRKRINKYGPNLGFANRKSDVRYLTSRISSLTDMDVVCVTIKGGSGLTNLQGSYLCQLAIVQYIETFSEKFRARVQDTFISVANGEVDTVVPLVEENYKKAKGTPTREENKQLQYDFLKACGEKKLLPIKPQQGINEGVLGMTGTKYKKLFGVPEPLNDNLSVDQVSAKNMAMVMATDTIRKHSDNKISQPEGVRIGRTSALQARVILSGALSDVLAVEVAKLKELDRLNEKRLTKEFKARKLSAV